MIHGSFYWCYVFSQVIGGLLTQYFGTKVVFGFSQFVTAICSLLIPQAAVIHYVLVIVLRSIQGIASVSRSKPLSVRILKLFHAIKFFCYPELEKIK